MDNTLWYMQLYIISHKAEESPDTCYNKDEPQKHALQQKKETKEYVWCELIYIKLRMTHKTKPDILYRESTGELFKVSL